MTTGESQKNSDIIRTFTELPINTLIQKNLSDANFVSPTPIQASALKPALAGRDVLGTAQTGTGKTLAFILPILERLMSSHVKGIDHVRSQSRYDVGTADAPLAHRTSNGVGALVLAPTRELAMQIIEELIVVGKGTGITATLAVGGLSEGKQIDSIRRGAKIIVATPGRLDDFVKRGLADLRFVKILVLDEADRMVDMGFLPQMRNIMNHVSKERQTMCFSATLDRTVAHLVHEYLKNPVRVEIGSTIKPAESVALRIYEVVREQKFSLLMWLLENETGTFLVFTRTKYGADKLFKKLGQRGIDVGVLHGGKSQPQRTRALEGFKTGKHRVLVATDIAARGIHVTGIAHVINYDMPQAAEDFIHRVGRTGRVEETGVATTFVMPEEILDVQSIERTLGKKIERLILPSGLLSEPRSLHDEAFDMRSRRVFRGRRSFGRRRY